MIEVPEHRDHVVNMSSDSLDCPNPHYFNFDCNFNVSVNNSKSESSEATDELQATGPAHGRGNFPAWVWCGLRWSLGGWG